MISRVRSARVLFVFVALTACTTAACSSGGSGSSGGSSGTTSGGTTSGGTTSGGTTSGGTTSGGTTSGGTTSGATSSASCCLGYDYYDCPSDSAAQSCFSNGSPGTCKANSSKNSKCCDASGFSCTKGSACCSGSCIDDPENPGDTICK